MKLHPMYDRVLIRRKDSETTTQGGLVIPEAAQERSSLAEVVAVGPGRFNEKTGALTPLKVEPGMTVLIGKWTGEETTIAGVEHLLVREDDILAAAYDE